jgi:RHS repeat-associated protein
MPARSRIAQVLATTLCAVLLLPAPLPAETARVVVTYDYDAFGNLLHQIGTTPNNYLYSGEQFDLDLHLYYNRARYLNTSTGRFWSADTFEGELNDPVTLHQYLYAGDDPEDNIDPSGEDFSIAEAVTSFAMSETLDNMSVPSPAFPKQNIQVTIDDGPLGTNASTRSVLAKYGIKTMFFVVGQEVVARPEAVKAILADGHSLGNHSFGHENLTHLSAAQVKESLRKTDSAVKRIAGYDMTPNWRAPGGRRNGTVDDAAASLGYTMHWGWDIDSEDSNPQVKGNNTAILKHIRNMLTGKRDEFKDTPCFKGTCQILFHDFSPNTLDFVLQNLKQDGVKFLDFPR